MRNVVLSWVRCAGCSVRDLVSDCQKVGKSWKKLGGFGEKLDRFGSLLGVFGVFLRGGFQECAQTQLAWIAYLDTSQIHHRDAEDAEKRRACHHEAHDVLNGWRIDTRDPFEGLGGFGRDGRQQE